jgi:hypothetical protein
MNIRLRGQTKTHKTIEGALLQTGGSKRFSNLPHFGGEGKLLTLFFRHAEMWVQRIAVIKINR